MQRTIQKKFESDIYNLPEHVELFFAKSSNLSGTHSISGWKPAQQDFVCFLQIQMFLFQESSRKPEVVTTKNFKT